MKASGSLPEPARTCIYLERGYDSDLTRKRLEEERTLIGVISEKESLRHYKLRSAGLRGAHELLLE